MFGGIAIIKEQGFENDIWKIEKGEEYSLGKLK
jgi:hypothetical protein